jgi:glutamate synthase domain-containing protein 2
MLPTRYWTWVGLILLTLVSLAMSPTGGPWPWVALFGGLLAVVGLIDVTQTRQAIRRNYPVLAHFRFLFEAIRPEIRQYFLESDTEAVPFSRAQRALVYQRAKNVSDKRPFGTQTGVYQPDYEWINHSATPSDISSHDFRITIGNDQCRQPYSASVFNISAMSFVSVRRTPSIP